MKKRVFIIHGWDGNPNKDWLPWAKLQIESKGYEAVVPLMPDTDNPQITAWLDRIKESIGQPKESDVLIGHSIGCQTIWRFLEQLPKGQKVGKVILIAPWLKLTNLENEEAWGIAKPWLETKIDFEKVKSKADLFTAIFSSDDQWVPLEDNRNMLEKALNPQVIILENKGHFSEEEGVNEIPEILDLL